MASPAPSQVSFPERFDHWARRVRARLAWRRGLVGVACGLALASVVAAGAWRVRLTSGGRCGALGLGLAAVGGIAGLAVARRRRWSDVDVALFLDERLQSEEAITTAIARRWDSGGGRARAATTDKAHGGDDAMGAVVVSRAREALARGDARRARPRVWVPAHALALPAVALLAVVARAPLPALPPHVDPPGTARASLGDRKGLDKAILLGQLDARDDAQRARLDKIAMDAAKLKEELTAGMDRRDAQDQIARLRDAIASERLSLGDGERRAGLESAVAKLGEHDATTRAARALGDHDLRTMDEQMERLANERERADREAAKQALGEAAAAAGKNGAPDVSKALEAEGKRLSERAKRADLLRQLADAMKAAGASNDAVSGGAEALDRARSDAAARALADAMGKALEGLTAEERERLAKKLAEQSQAKGRSPADADALKDLADSLSTQEGQKKLLEALRQMANDDETSDEARRQQALDDADNGAGGTEGQLGGGPGGGEPSGPSHGHGPTGEGSASAGGAQRGLGGGAAEGRGGAGGAGHGGSHDTGTGGHAGSTSPVAADTLRSRATGPLNHGASMPGTVTAYTAGKAGGTANTLGTGSLGVVGPGEVDGIENSDVPQEYREHVRQYFQP